MKILLAFCFLLLNHYSHAQTWEKLLPADSVTHKICYQGVVQVPGATQAELYSRAREWFASSFGSAKAVLEMDDASVGKLIGNANSRYYEHYLGNQLDMVLWRRINVQVKDGRFKYVISDFAVGVSPKAQAACYPMESFLSPHYFNKQGEPNKVAMQKIEGVKQSGESQVASLCGAMVKTPTKSDW